MTKITVLSTSINVIIIKDEDYICITDMLKAKDGDFFIADWLRNRNTLEYLGIWEKLYNPAFNYGEFATIRNQAGLNSFKISVKEYVEKTDAIKQNLIPGEVTPQQASRIYASEADVLNVAMFGMTALEWRDAHPDLKGNVRDHAGINDGLPQHERLVRLNRIAIEQMRLLEDVNKKYLK